MTRPSLYSAIAIAVVLANPAWVGGGRGELSPDAEKGGFDNGEWVVQKLGRAGIPEPPFKVRIDGTSLVRTRLLAFANRVGNSSRFPQVLVIASSEYLRIKSGADPNPSLPFGQSLVLGPAIFGTSTSVPNPTLFFNPQIQRVDVDTDRLGRDGTGNLLIRIAALDRNLGVSDTPTNQIMNLTWEIILDEPTKARTRIRVRGAFEFTEDVTPAPDRTAEYESFRLIQISSMFIDEARHDVDAMRYGDAAGPVEVLYDPELADSLLPAIPSALHPDIPVLDSVHTDDVGQPNGDTPSYRISMRRITGPTSGPLVPRAYLDHSEDLNEDNLGLWIHHQPSDVILRGTKGTISFAVVATRDALSAP